MLKFKTLELHNYLSFKDAKLSLDNRGVILVEGKNHSNNAYQSNGSGKCLSGDTLVFNADKNSYERLDTFVDNKVEHTLGLVNYKLQVVPVTGWHKTGTKPVYKLRTDSGAEITGAETHPVLTDTGYKPISELNVGDWVAETRKLPTSPSQNALPDKFWFALGILLGDGGLTKGRIISLTNMEECIFDAVVAGVRVMDPECHFGKSNLKGKAMTSRLNASPNFNKWLSIHGLREKSVDKKIPNTIMCTLTTSNTECLLSGIYITDGTFPSAQQKAPRRVLDFTTGSKELAYNVKELWLKLGVPTSVTTRKVKNMPGHTYWRVVTFSNSYDICLHHLHLIGNRVGSLKSVAGVFAKKAYNTPQSNKDIIPPAFNKYVVGHSPRVYPVGVNPLKYHRTESQLKVHGFSRDTFACWVPEDNAVAHSDVTWVKVKSIAYMGEEPCYDLTIGNDDHSYLANNIVVHNSNILSGVTYALYGKTVEGVSGDGVINRQAGTDCHVFLTMDRDGVLYRIERYRKGKNHNANKVKLFANDKEITTSKAALTNAKIEELLGIDFGTYVNTIAYGQGDEPVFSQATDKGKKEILENLANIGVYEKAQAVAKQKLSEEQLQLTTLKAKSASLENSITLISQYKQQAEQQVAAQKAEKAKDKKDAKNLKDLIQDSITKEAGHKMTWEKAQQKRSEYQATNPIPQASDLSKQVSDLSSKQYTAQYNANDAQAKIKKALADLKNAAAATNCPVCGAPLDANHRAQEVARLKDEIARLADTYKASKATTDSITPQLKDSQDKLNAVDTQARAIYSQLQSLQGSENAAQRAYEQQANSTKMMQTRLESLVNKSYATIKTDYAGDMDKIKTELSQIDDKIAEHDTMSDNYQQLVDKVFSRKGVSSMALDLVVPFLNEHTNHYLAKLSGSILRVNMSTQTLNSDKSLSDKFDIQVQNDSGANSYQQCSTGEKKRIDIAIAFAIQDLQNSKSNMATNIAIYDECFDGLDAIGAETVIELLKEKSKSVGSIFVITHNDTLKPFFDSVITVEKGKEGISHVIGGESVEN